MSTTTYPLDEKLDKSADHIDDVEDQKNAQHAEESEPAFDPKETKRILRKVDVRLIPVLALLYLLAFLDRSNIANARVAGMNDELGLTGSQYNMALTVFFFPYAIFEVPSNIVLKLMRPSIWISILMVAWGIVMTLQGIVETYEHLIVTRVLLGLFESGFFPAATFLITCWYCRFEVQTRMAVFFSAASLASAFSGLLAAAIVNMDGIAGLGGWRWIFILEGIVTVVVGAALYWILPDSPQSASWLEPWEQQYLIRRLAADSGTKGGRVQTSESFQWRYITAALTDWRIWLAVIIYWGNSIPLYGFTYAAPNIILGLGYTSVEAQLLTVPVYFVGACSTVLFAWLSDRHQSRWPFILIPFTIAACSFVALLAIPHPRLPGLTYAFLFGIPAGVYPPIIGILSWIGNNLAPTWKRSVGMALLISIGNLGGAIGSNIFLEEEKPNYWLGYGFSLGILLAGMTATLIIRLSYGSVNKRRDKISEAQAREQYSEEELLALGDKSPLYRYVV
ncbi:hypothetical protein Q7P37_007062 [Cladosporium fusiforme]